MQLRKRAGAPPRMGRARHVKPRRLQLSPAQGQLSFVCACPRDAQAKPPALRVAPRRGLN